MKTKTKYSPLVELVDRLNKCLNTESAQRVLKLRADAKMQKYMDQLANKSTEGELTPEERAEYRDIVALDAFLAILKSKIRQRLATAD